jgi:uncharacterized protein (DUF1778 family)
MAGRHKKPAIDSKTQMLRIRMTENDRLLLEEAAKAKSMETSTWARSELFDLARRAITKSRPISS